MNRRKFLVGSTAALTSTGLFVGTQGFSRVGSQREVRIQVEGDEDAYLGLHFPDETFSFECFDTLEIPITNQTKEKLVEIEIEPEIVGNGVSLDDYEVSEEIATGEQGYISAELSCESGETTQAYFGFDIEVEGESGETLINAQRGSEVELECFCETGLSFVAFCGDVDNGDLDNVSVHVADGDADRITWDTDKILDKVVLYGGFGGRDFEGKQTFLNFTTGIDNGEVSVDDDAADEVVPRNPPEGTETGQSPDCPGGENSAGVKFELASGAFNTEEFNCTD